jgi:superfamily I DNA and RNA helicase
MALTLINGVNIVEGIAGSLATMIFYYILKKLYMRKEDMAIRLGIAFSLTWLIRKLAVNIYTQKMAPKGIIIQPIRF